MLDLVDTSCYNNRASPQEESVTTTPKYYVNNRQLLAEIHLSKMSFCTFRDKTVDHQFDAVLHSLDDLTDERIYAAQTARAARLTASGTATEACNVPVTDLVFRLPTWEHIPLAPPKPPKNPPKRENLTELFDFDEDFVAEIPEPEMPLSKKHVRLNFPPFFHYRLTESGTAEIVGKSHWRGDLDTGEFCRSQGQITNRLGEMFIMMTERYSSRGNWRSYTYVDEMRGAAISALVVGGLQFDETKGSNPFSFYTTVITNAFTGYLLIERKNQNIRDDILEANGLNPSFTRQFANSYNFAGKHGPVEIIKPGVTNE